MFHPVGSQPPSVYWRRRLLFLGSAVILLVLIVLTVSTLSGGSGTPQGQGTGGSPTPSSSSPSTPSATRTSGSPSTSGSSTGTQQSSNLGSAPGSPSSTAMPKTCSLSALQLTAKTDKQTYATGADPVVALQVVNPGPAPCSRDLSDRQIELRVYNGTSRVWGSHDCEVQAGSAVQTLAAGKAYEFQIKWTGLTSSPGACKTGERQRVGAGSYSLYASLSGTSARAGQFQIN